jgi:cytochrome c biogenesis protein CcmG/thiol:disulfide interchange protein DsbE
MRFDRKSPGRRLPVVFVLLIALLLSSGPALAAKKMPDFSAPTVNGLGAFDSASLQGKVVLVNFWATCCPPCRKEIPSLAMLQEKYRDKGFAVVGVSMDEGGSRLVGNFLKKQKVNYPVIIGDSDLARGFGGVAGVPASFLADRKGELVRRYDGFATEDELREEIEKLLN